MLLVRPMMEYGSSAWVPHTQRNIDRLEMVQRRAARFVKGDHDRTDSVTSMLTNLRYWIPSKKEDCRARQWCLQDFTLTGYPKQLPISSQPDHVEDMTCVFSSHSIQCICTSVHSSSALWGFGTSCLQKSSQLPALRCSNSGCHSSTQCKEIFHFKTVYKLLLSAPQLAGTKFENTRYADWWNHRKKKKASYGIWLYPFLILLIFFTFHNMFPIFLVVYIFGLPEEVLLLSAS